MCHFLSGCVTIERDPRLLCHNLVHHEITVDSCGLEPESYREWEWTKDDNGESLVVRVLPDENPNVLKSAILAKYPTRADCLDECLRQIAELTVVDVSGTPITRIDAPQATRLYCSGCTALKTLDAPQATELLCYNCTALEVIDAPQATELDCDGCIALETLDAPQTTELRCYNCTALERP